MKKLEQKKCPNCGYKNIELAKKCTKCHYRLDTDTKSCPRCGKVQSLNVVKCSCGFSFNKKKKGLLWNLFISISIMGLLFIVSIFNEGLVTKFSFGIKVLLGFFVFVLFVKTLTHASDSVVNYDAEDEIIETQQPLIKMKNLSNIAVIVGAIIIIIFLIYYYFFR